MAVPATTRHQGALQAVGCSAIMAMLSRIVDVDKVILGARVWFFRWLYIILALGMMALIAAPPRPLVALGAQQQVETTNPKIGVHTRLTDEVEPWKIQRTLHMVREMGAPWIVEYFPWAYIEPAPGRFDWRHADLVVDHARRQGLTVIARLGLVPPWARPKESINTYLAEQDFDQFAQYVSTFVGRYRERLSHVIIWNEPNLSLEWGYRLVDPEGYVRLLQVAYRAAKEAEPDVVVLAGALAPTLAPAGSEEGMNDLLYLQRMYDAGAAPFFDGLAAHAYGWTASPDEPAGPERINFSRVELLRQVMVENGDGEKGIYITEGGWSDHPRWTKAVKPSQRIDFTIRAYQKVQEEWPWCEMVAFWAFRFPWPTRTYQDYFAYVGVDFAPRPVYLDVQQYTQIGLGVRPVSFVVE